jgi:hypothetical protein
VVVVILLNISKIYKKAIYYFDLFHLWYRKTMKRKVLFRSSSSVNNFDEQDSYFIGSPPQSPAQSVPRSGILSYGHRLNSLLIVVQVLKVLLLVQMQIKTQGTLMISKKKKKKRRRITLSVHQVGAGMKDCASCLMCVV